MYRERFYELKCQVFTQAKIMKMRSTQNDNKIEEMLQLPNVDQTLYTVISEKNKKKKSPYKQRQSSPCKEPRERK